MGLSMPLNMHRSAKSRSNAFSESKASYCNPPYIITLLTPIINTGASVFVTSSHFYPSMMIADKARSQLLCSLIRSSFQHFIREGGKKERGREDKEQGRKRGRD
jgi:hypothetical protein